jgi:hypothetical protein
VTLTSASLVLAALQKNVAGLWVQAAVPNVPGAFHDPPEQGIVGETRLAWFVVNSDARHAAQWTS